MTKYFLIGLGFLLILLSLISFVQYSLDYDQLSSYGKGFVWGKLILLSVGFLLTFFGFKKKKPGPKF